MGWMQKTDLPYKPALGLLPQGFCPPTFFIALFKKISMCFLRFITMSFFVNIVQKTKKSLNNQYRQVMGELYSEVKNKTLMMTLIKVVHC